MRHALCWNDLHTSTCYWWENSSLPGVTISSGFHLFSQLLHHPFGHSESSVFWEFHINHLFAFVSNARASQRDRECFSRWHTNLLNQFWWPLEKKHSNPVYSKCRQETITNLTTINITDLKNSEYLMVIDALNFLNHHCQLSIHNTNISQHNSWRSCLISMSVKQVNTISKRKISTGEVPIIQCQAYFTYLICLFSPCFYWNHEDICSGVSYTTDRWITFHFVSLPRTISTDASREVSVCSVKCLCPW